MKFLRVILMVSTLAVCAAAQTPAPAFNTGQAARLIIGQVNFTSGNFGATNTLLGSPSAVAFANGTLWVVDANRLGATPNNNRVLRYSDAATFPTPTQDPTIPGSTCGVCRGVASLVLGQPDFISSGFAVTPTGMRSPTGIATDGTTLVVADTDNNRVLIWRTLPKSNGQPADVVIGQPDFVHAGTSVPPSATSLRGPEGVWISGGKIFVADTQDNRVLIYNHIPTANNAAADVVVGQVNFSAFVQPDLTQINATPSASNMQSPVSVTTDATHMYVTDLGQSRVLIFNSIPTSNGAAADVAIGQPDLVSAQSNNSYVVTDATLNSANNPTAANPVLCASDAAYASSLGQTGNSAVDSAGSTIYPTRCAATLSFPRMALSDGKRLFVADGGNDRVLVFNSIPTKSGQRADAILGEPDEYSDNTGQNPDGSNTFQTPTSIAFDPVNQNLYVADTYNRRVTVFTPGPLNIPLFGVRNAASLEIYALGSVALSGAITAKDTVTITVNGTDYTYTILATDTLETITTALVNLINKGPDPNVVASQNIATDTVVLTARKPGADGGNITLTATESTNATILPTTSGATLNIYLQDPTTVAAGTLVQISGSNLCDTSTAASYSGAYLPFSLNGCELFIDGNRVPLLYVSPTQINAQMPVEYTDRTSVSLYARTTHADGSITATVPIAATLVAANPGIFAQYGSDPRTGILYHAFSSATGMISVDGSINAGDIGTVTIGSATYTYTVTATDTLDTIRAAFVNLINSAPDANVYASPTNTYDRILLTALVPGTGGEGTTIAVGVTAPSPVPTGSSATSALILTALNPTVCCSNIGGAPVSPDNPAQPGEILYLFATGLGVTSPSDQNSGQIFDGSSANAPLIPVDTVLTNGATANVVNVALVPGLVGVYYVQFQLSSGLTTDPATQLHIAQGAAVSNVVTFPVVAQ